MYKEREINLEEEKLNILKNYFDKKEQILTVYIFGSHGTIYENELSDIDFGILFQSDLSLMNELTIAGKIEMTIGKKVDLVSLNKVNIDLKYKIIKTGKLIYEKCEVKTADFVEQVLKDYFDFGVKLKTIKQDFHLSLKEEYIDEGGP